MAELSKTFILMKMQKKKKIVLVVNLKRRVVFPTWIQMPPESLEKVLASDGEYFQRYVLTNFCK